LSYNRDSLIVPQASPPFFSFLLIAFVKSLRKPHSYSNYIWSMETFPVTPRRANRVMEPPRAVLARVSLLCSLFNFTRTWITIRSRRANIDIFYLQRKRERQREKQGINDLYHKRIQIISKYIKHDHFPLISAIFSDINYMMSVKYY